MHRHIVTALALAGSGMVAMATAAPAHAFQVEQVLGDELRFNRHLAIGRRSAGERRSKGKQAHPKRRRNMVAHSRRVRRRHRRAA